MLLHIYFLKWLSVPLDKGTVFLLMGIRERRNSLKNRPSESSWLHKACLVEVVKSFSFGSRLQPQSLGIRVRLSLTLEKVSVPGASSGP